MNNLLDKYTKINSVYTYKLENAILSKNKSSLRIDISSNFVVIYSELKLQEEKIKEKFSSVENVSINFTYDFSKLNDTDIQENIREYLYYIFDGLKLEYSSILMKTPKDKIFVNNENVEISVAGAVIEEKFNSELKDIISNKIFATFKKKMYITFLNDEEFCRDIITKKKENERELIKGLEIKARENENKINNTSGDEKSTKPNIKSSVNKKNNSMQKDSNNKFRKKQNFEPRNIFVDKISGEPIDMSNFDVTTGNCIVEGQVFTLLDKAIREDSIIVTIMFWDGTDSICGKLFVNKEQFGELKEKIQIGTVIRVKGKSEYDSREDSVMMKIYNISLQTELQNNKRVDNATEKRVELHAHTKFSAMDAIADVGDLIQTAINWGHKAVAITDHGAVQSFPKAASKAKDKIKVIYGVEGYLIDDRDCIREDGSIDYKKNGYYHIILLAKNQTGLKNIYQLVSMSHIDYFYKKPRIPKSILKQYREGIIIGSACEAGEIFRAVLNDYSESQIDEIIDLYDYLEVQPIINNNYLVANGRVEDDEALRDLNRKIIKLGEKYNKPVVATCDVHYINKEDSIYRKILQAGQGYKDLGVGGLYFRTTEEMFDEFSYLSYDKAKEIIVDNPQMIANNIDYVKPVKTGKYPPHIDNAEEKLRTLCYTNVHKMYGEKLPEKVEKRLEDELKAIIDEGYAVMYISAQMLVDKSMQDGYIVGSRGSVGSSFAATMSGITEVNPLPPHYLCPECKYIEWGDEKIYDCGIDMPEKICPNCGSDLAREGFTIPFETFLGIPGKQKEPDIDLNFAGEYQETAQKYVDEIFGEENTFKAGTVGTIKEKTAFGFVAKYCDEYGVAMNKFEKERISKGLDGIKRTTGQHPGGIIILPQGMDIYDFCPVQKPADKQDAKFITTHFDYHAIDENLLKLDILGHDAPSIIYRLKELTGIDPMNIILNDNRVRDLFVGIDSLDILDKENYALTHGTYGLPEFGTKLVREMLDDTKPQNFGDLVRISGFSHGTDVWANNAQDYIKNGIATMKDAISTRDDIMNYLILNGVPAIPAFTIMEKVRKGKGVTDEEAELMKEHGTPQWYIDSCRKIKYMFPRAHAVAYVSTAYRIAWFKIYQPLAFYASFLDMKINDFNWDVIKQGPEHILKTLKYIQAKGFFASDKEKEELKLYEICYEMLSRGYEFENPSLEKSDASKFEIADGKIVVPIHALPNIGINAAIEVKKAFEEGDFISVEDMQRRATINKTAVESLRDNGLIDGLQERDQISFF
ncbi:MAG: PolC-type DNA polymerase III [Eubacteriales bacterium]|nr:PolC-type DNA polymerase III [Eubacteriales bacterium]MDY3332987.1 PolC-type DNA polymerase III [Gallibacter sp.]